MASSLPRCLYEHEITATLCPACGDILDDPRLLSCLHSLCLKCLEENAEHSTTDGDTSVVCPKCGETTTVQDGNVSTMPSNVYLKRLIEYRQVILDAQPSPTCSKCDADTKYWCITCKESLCHNCKSSHGLENHRLKPLNDLLATMHRSKSGSQHDGCIFCERHKEWMIFYCLSCMVFMCESCQRYEHKSHGYTVPGDEGRIFRRLFSEKDMEEMSSKFDMFSKKMHLSEEETVEKLRQARDQFIENIQQEFTDAESKVRQMFLETQEKMNTMSVCHEKKLRTLTGSLQLMDTFAENAKDDEILYLKGSLEGRIDTLQSVIEHPEFPEEREIPQVDVSVMSPEKEFFSVRRKVTPIPQTRRIVPKQKINDQRKKEVRETSKKEEKKRLDEVKDCRVLFHPNSRTVADVCWVNGNEMVLVDPGQNKVIVFDSMGRKLWDRIYVGAQNVAVVDGVVVCDSVDAVYPQTKDTVYYRVYVSTKSGPFPVAKTLFCNKIYVGSINKNQIKIYNKDGRKNSVIQLEHSFAPIAMALDSKFDVIAVDSDTRFVWRISSSGNITPFYKPDDKMKAWEPRGLCIDADDMTYILNTAGATVLQLSRNGDVLFTLGIPFRAPRGLSVNRNKELISADENGSVWCFRM